MTTTALEGQGCYASAMGSLDWLDTSYSPLQLIEKYKLPTLVRICEGYYGNTSNSCFSAMDVIKMHEIQRVDMILTKVVEGTGSKYPDAPEHTRFCFPKHFAGRFDPIHQTGDKQTKCFKNVRKLAEMFPHFVRVKKRPCKKGEGPDKDDILEILGLDMCEAWWEERGFLRCRNQDGDEVMLSLKWAGIYEAIPDPEGYTLQDMLKRFNLPCKVTFRNPQSHLHPESDLLKLLPLLEGALVLDREITHEFLVGTAVDVGAFAQPLGSGASGSGFSAKANSAQHQTAVVPWVVLTKNANVLFQICQDMVHKRATYMSLLDMFGDCCMDKVPVELFICEYAAPLVAFARTEEPPPSVAGSKNDLICMAPHSKSAPDLSLDPDDKAGKDDGFCRLLANSEVGKWMNQRKLPPLPPEANPTGIDRWVNKKIPRGQWHRFGSLPSKGHEAGKKLPFQDNVAIPFRLVSTTENVDDEDGALDYGPYTKPTDQRGYVAKRPDGAIASDFSTNKTTPRAMPIAILAPPVPPHPDPPTSFSSNYAQMDEVKSEIANPESRDAPPTRQPPPPPPRTTPRKKESNTDRVYGNIALDPISSEPTSSEPTKPISTTPKSSPSATSCRAPQAPQPCNIYPDIPWIRHLSPRHLELLGTGDLPHEKSSCNRLLSSLPASEYLKPRYPPGRTESTSLIAASRSRSTETLLEEIGSSDSPSSSDGSTVLGTSSAVQSRLITPCKPTRRITSVHHIPSDISTLTSSELAQCLRLLRLREEIVTRFQDHQINGSLLVQLTSQTVRNELQLSDFEAEKVYAFLRGWRPDEEA